MYGSSYGYWTSLSPLMIKHMQKKVEKLKNLKKLERFKEGCYSEVKETKFGEPATPYSRSKAHSHNVSYYTDKDGKTNINPEELGIESIKKMYSIQIDKIIKNRS